MEFIENIEREEYTKFVINHINSHFLKSYEWGVVSRKRGLTPHYVGLKDKNKLVATALLLEKKLPLGYKYYYIPRGYTIDYTNKDLLNKLTLKHFRWVDFRPTAFLCRKQLYYALCT